MRGNLVGCDRPAGGLIQVDAMADARELRATGGHLGITSPAGAGCASTALVLI
jgi:hypothetical protein